MSNKNGSWTKEKKERYIKEGRGQGTLANYIPWTKTTEFSSKGRVSRVFGTKTGRIHHLQSDNQYRAFLIFEFADITLDIRESYPLLDVMEVIDDKDDLRFDKFCDKETKEPFVITTNFLLTIKDDDDGAEKYIARTVKNTSELKRKITWEKLEIERRYWEEKNIDWKIVTEKQLSRELAMNIQWVRETLLPGSTEELDKERFSVSLLRYLLENEDFPINESLKVFDKKEGLKRGSALFLFRYLIASKELRINMGKVIDLSNNIRNLIL